MYSEVISIDHSEEESTDTPAVETFRIDVMMANFNSANADHQTAHTPDEPGWYFFYVYSEESIPHGPFESESEALDAAA